MTTSLSSSVPELLKEPDGFRVEIDESRERADIILDRPPLNIVTIYEREQLRATFEELDRLASVRAIVLRAQGNHFSSGGYIKGFTENSPEMLSELARNVAAPERCHKPVVAAIHGYCFGVAFELALACDFRIVSESARLGLPEQKIGMMPGSGGAARLMHMIGISRAKDMVMRARRITGRTAQEWGIAIDCVQDETLGETTDKLVEELLKFSPLAQRTIKNVLNASQDAPLHVGIELEGQAFGRLRSSDDFREGAASFHEKREPRFKGT